MWSPGDRVSHRNNPELGPGLVIDRDPRRVTVLFPEKGETLQIAARSDALVALELRVGGRARVEDTGEVVLVDAVDGDVCVLGDGRELPVRGLWPLPDEETLVQRLARGDVDAPEDFKNRLDGLRLARLRRADGLGSFLGGRVHLFPHQLYVAEQATAALEHGPVRWLLADEVGLGKTVEACLVMNRLIHTGEAERTLVVVPETLALQWLGELWRKYHQVFVLLDDKRLSDVESEHGRGFNPFDVHRRVIVSLERLAEDRRLVEQAVEAGIDLLVVDEAHHLRRRPGHPGNPAYRAVRPLTELGRHVLLLSATPLEDDAHGFFRLLQLLRPDDLPEETPFGELLERREPLPPCTSATRRQDIGGLPPRTPVPVEIDDAEGWGALGELVRLQRARPAEDALARRRKAESVWRALASPAALTATSIAAPVPAEVLDLAGRRDPRQRWLAEQALGWARRRQKTLVFVAHRETLNALRTALEAGGRTGVGVFHEELSPERRDLEVARFRLPEGPSILISTECGGEGRNFEFCHRLVLFDLPWNPAVVEQRIGRLDRIGRTRPTEIVYFRPPDGFGRVLVDLYEAIGIFRESLGGLVRGLRHVDRAVSDLAIADVEPSLDALQGVLKEAKEARDRVHEAAYHELHRDPYHRDLAPGILERVPESLDSLTEAVVMRAAARFGFGCEEQTGPRCWLVEYGSHALLDHLPGVPEGSRFRGTFDREHAVANETLDFFASGHPLVEGILAELGDGPRGRVALLQVRGESEMFGLLAVFRSSGDQGLELWAVDGKGERLPEIEARFAGRDLTTEPVDAKRWTGQPSWPKGIRRLARALPSDRQPLALAAFRVRAAGRARA
ncbi:MAG: SNF2-related protein [Acidobacteriota bacterium]